MSYLGRGLLLSSSGASRKQICRRRLPAVMSTSVLHLQTKTGVRQEKETQLKLLNEKIEREEKETAHPRGSLASLAL